MKKGFILLMVLLFLISAQFGQAQNTVPFQPSVTGDLEQYHNGAFGNRVLRGPYLDLAGGSW